MLNSILKAPDLETPLKSQKIQIFRFSLLCKIEKSKDFELRSNISGRPLGDRKLHAKNSDSQPPGGPGIAKIGGMSLGPGSLVLTDYKKWVMC